MYNAIEIKLNTHYFELMFSLLFIPLSRNLIMYIYEELACVKLQCHVTRLWTRLVL